MFCPSSLFFDSQSKISSVKFVSSDNFPYFCPIIIIQKKYMMETREETTAEIALGVRKATRERTEAEIAEVKAQKREILKEERAMRKVRKEKFATFYFGLSTLFLTSTGIGGLSPILFNDVNKDVNWYTVIIGSLLSIFFAIKASNELKI